MNNLERITKTVEVGQLQWYSRNDVVSLLSIVEQADTALSHIADLHIRGIEDRAADPHRAIASDALKAIRGN